MDKRPNELFDYAVFTSVGSGREWNQCCYVVASRDDHVLRDVIKSLLSGPDPLFVAVEKQIAAVGPFFEYWTGSNGEVRRYTPKAR